MTEPTEPSKHSHDFERVVSWASAISMAAAGGFLASLREVHPSVQFRFSFATIAAFLGSGAFTLLFFRVLMSRGKIRCGDAAAAPARYRRWLILFSSVGLLGLLASVSFALRGISYEKRMDVITGAGIAIAVLAVVAWVWWKTVRFFESDEEQNHPK